MARQQIGRTFFVFGIGLMILLTFACGWLGLVSWDILIWPTIGSILGLLSVSIGFFSRQASLSSEGLFSPRILGASILALFGIAATDIIVRGVLGVYSLAFVSLSGILFVDVLFAIHEENLFLGVRTAFAGRMHPIAIVLINALVFIPYHALRYPVEILYFAAVLFASRIVLDSVAVFSNHSDPPYIAHVGWNVLVHVIPPIAALLGITGGQ